MPPTPSPTPILLEVVGGQSSFWDSPAFVGLLALAGVALGAWLSYLFSRRQEEGRATREKAQRWDESVRDLTAQLASEVDELITVARSAESEYESRKRLIVDGMIANDGTRVLEEIYGQAKIYEALQRVVKTGSSLDLIAPQSLRQHINAIQVKAHGSLTVSSTGDLDTKATELYALSVGLKESVRDHFGLTGKRR